MTGRGENERGGRQEGDGRGKKGGRLFNWNVMKKKFTLQPKVASASMTHSGAGAGGLIL